ncbi:nickel/cobalt transporter [Aureimonas sp. N4]|uniref:nickel/cobalt transporter n=1 Tax=Aureimonas sp. N4 TaxID=1638165 RepID=UPI000785EBC9|nr:nickel/cobalt transporter [Aureimonas sp. N4]
MRSPLRLAGPTLLCLCLLTGVALAQSSLGIGNAEVTPTPSGPFAGLMMEILRIQRGFFVDLRHALVAIRDGQGGFGWLVGLSFIYGIFHAAGPGHGKAVISSYMLANEVELRRGIALSFASAIAQALSAAVIVLFGWMVLRGTSLSMTQAAFGLELMSYLGVAAIGIWLVLRKGHALLRRLPVLPLVWRAPQSGPQGLAFAGAGTFTDRTPGGPKLLPRASGAYGSDVCDDAAGDACDCGRPHIFSASELGGKGFSWRSALAAVVAVGLRPCSGAIVVLTFALLNGLYGSGLLSVFAMALGTAITVSALAALAVGAKDVVLRLGQGASRLRPLRALLEFSGALLLVSLGFGLFFASLA